MIHIALLSTLIRFPQNIRRNRNLRLLRNRPYAAQYRVLTLPLKRPTPMVRTMNPAAQRNRNLPCSALRLQRIKRPRPEPRVPRRTLLRLLDEILEQRCECRYSSDDDTQVVLDSRPHDQTARVEVVGQVADGADAQDLDDGDEGAEGEQAEKNGFLSFLDAAFEQNGEGKKHSGNFSCGLWGFGGGGAYTVMSKTMVKAAMLV